MAKRKKTARVALGDEKLASNNPFAAALAGLSAPAGEESPPIHEEVAPNESLNRVRTRVERKGHGGKTVTLVEGVPDSRLDDVAASLRTALGTGVRIDGDRLVVQGDLRDRVTAWVAADQAD